ADRLHRDAQVDASARRVRDVQRERRSDGAVEPREEPGVCGPGGAARAIARSAAMREAARAAKRRGTRSAYDLLARASFQREIVNNVDSLRGSGPRSLVNGPASTRIAGVVGRRER